MTRKLGTLTFTCKICLQKVTMETGNHRIYCGENCAKVARKARQRKFVIRHLDRGEPIPTGTPLRYKVPSGYIALRWRLEDGTYVEVMEHRVFNGRNSECEQVHHINHIRDDNRPENLMELTTEEHQAIHNAENRAIHAQMVPLYESGMTTTEIAQRFHTYAGNVYRILVNLGVEIRPPSAYRPPIPDSATERFLAGEGAGSIARSLGVSYGRLVRHLESRGVQRRPVGRVPRNLVRA